MSARTGPKRTVSIAAACVGIAALSLLYRAEPAAARTCILNEQDEVTASDGSAGDAFGNSGSLDAYEVAAGTSPDDNGNDRPDECDECLVDADCDDADGCTVDYCRGGFCENIAAACCGDVNRDLSIDVQDLVFISDHYDCPVGAADFYCDLADANLDGFVDEQDNQYVRKRFGECSGEPLVVARGPFRSIQVNVNTQGQNILGDAANEPSIAVDPTNRRNMVIGWRQFDTVDSGFRQAGYAFSHDGGETWMSPGKINPGELGSDPVLDVDADGNFYYLSLRGVRPSLNNIYKSTTRGVTWPLETFAFGGDKPWMAIDRTDGPGRNNIYASWWFSIDESWSSQEPLWIRSTDGGHYYTPWPLPLRLDGGTITVGPEGQLLTGGKHLGGVSFQMLANPWVLKPPDPSAFTVRWVDIGGGARMGGPGGGLLSQTWIAADHSKGSTRGNIYILGSRAPFGSADPLDVMFTASADGGMTWSTPSRVNDDPVDNGAWQWFGTMSVAPNGRIDVIWNDTRNDPSATFSEAYYTYSVTAGLTWAKSIPVSQPFNHSLGRPQGSPKLGDYYDMVSDNGGACLAYAATFNGEQDVYFLRLGDCNTNGVHDAQEIMSRPSLDKNTDGLIDSCGAGGTGVQRSNQKIDICHVTGSEEVWLINVSEHTAPAHVAHGDFAPLFFYVDGDGDGYGDPEDSVEGCTAPAGYAGNRDDFDDEDPIVHPKAEMEISYSYELTARDGSGTLFEQTGTVTLISGDASTVYEQARICGPEHPEIARCETHYYGDVRAYSEVCSDGSWQGNYGSWRSRGCSVARDRTDAFISVVECCIQ